MFLPLLAQLVSAAMMAGLAGHEAREVGGMIACCCCSVLASGVLPLCHHSLYLHHDEVQMAAGK